mmetsp:Transcript_22446/g.51413  ORF Transcript_22446/g.51413 Transcript_22446/m.51413 type:complete len:224 (+) Transcript_22446:1057-1728(+)
MSAFRSSTSLAFSLRLASVAPFSASSQPARCAFRSARNWSTDAEQVSATFAVRGNASVVVKHCLSFTCASSSCFLRSSSTTSRACNFSLTAFCARDRISSSLFMFLVSMAKCSRACCSSRRNGSTLSSACCLIRSSAAFHDASKPALPSVTSCRVCCMSCFKLLANKLSSALSWTDAASSSPARSRLTDVSPSCRLELSLQRRSLSTAVSCCTVLISSRASEI